MKHMKGLLRASQTQLDPSIAVKTALKKQLPHVRRRRVSPRAKTRAQSPNRTGSPAKGLQGLAHQQLAQPRLQHRVKMQARQWQSSPKQAGLPAERARPLKCLPTSRSTRSASWHVLSLAFGTSRMPSNIWKVSSFCYKRASML